MLRVLRHHADMLDLAPPPPLGPATFFTLAVAVRGSDLLLRHINLLRQSVRLTRAEQEFEIDAWVVLPDHLHCILRLPVGAGDFAGRWRLIEQRFTRALPVDDRRAAALQTGAVWAPQASGKLLLSAQDLALYRGFCWRDPVLHGLVSAPQDWAFTSMRPQPLRQEARV